jgi:transcriptional regulator with XRE-family HTH domain
MSKQHSDAVRSRFLQAKTHILSNQLSGVKTLSQFADKVGEYSQNFSKMERGERYPTIDSICMLCLEFGISTSWLLLDIGDMLGRPTNGDLSEISERLRKVEEDVKKLKQKK